MSQTVADMLVGVLEQIGVKHIFGLIGNSLNPLADAVRHSKIEWIGVRHEEGAALAAAGQAKLTGRLAVCCGTTGPGSTHLVAGLYEASPRPRAGSGALRRYAAQDAGHRLHPDDRARSFVSRRLALYRNHLVAGASAGRHSSGDRGRLCRARRRSSDAAAGRHRRKGGRHRIERRDLKPRPEIIPIERGNCRYRPPHRCGRQRRDHVRQRLPRRRGRIARAVGPAQGAAHSFGQGQGHYAV